MKGNSNNSVFVIDEPTNHSTRLINNISQVARYPAKVGIQRFQSTGHRPSPVRRIIKGILKTIHSALLFVTALLTTTVVYAADAKIFIDCADCPEMVTIPEGSFEMGSNSGNASEMPVHSVTIAHAFAMGKTEVTQGQWKSMMGNNPSGFGDCGDNCPVENFSWDDAQKFIQKLNAKTGKQYRLPSEAEWEYAARAGSTTAFPWGEQASHEYANYGADECCKGFALGRDQWVNTSPAGSFPANAFGLYDMIGNVWEWTEDSYHDDYTGAPVDGSAWSGDSGNRVFRGGSWYFKPQRTAYRGRNVPTYRYHNFGFRLARTLP